MNNVVFWDVALCGSWVNWRFGGKYHLHVWFDVFTEVTMKNVVFWDVALCRSCINRRFGKIHCLLLQGRTFRERGTRVSRMLQKVPPKRRLTQDVHSDTSLKTTFVIYFTVLRRKVCYFKTTPFPFQFRPSFIVRRVLGGIVKKGRDSSVWIYSYFYVY
jgi:hypothetical protein